MPITKPQRYISNAYLNSWVEYSPFKWNEIVPLTGGPCALLVLLIALCCSKSPSTLKESLLTVSEAEGWQGGSIRLKTID